MSSFPAPGAAPAPAPSPEESDRLSPAVQALIAISVAVMFVQLTVFDGHFPELLAFEWSALPGRWFTVFTYLFAHAGIVHLVANMYALFLFGPRVERVLGARKFVWFYLLCGMGGVIFEMVFVRSGVLIGSSAAVFGVMTAYAMQWPDDEVYLMFVVPLRVRTLVAGLLVFNLVLGLVGTLPGGLNLAYFAHLGGVLAAYVYMRMAAAPGIDLGRQRVANLPDVDEPPRAIPRNMPRRERGDEVDDIVAKSKAIMAKQAATVTPVPRRPQGKAEEMNRVLDKISEHGIDSLTSDERELLEEMSKRLKES